MPKKTKANPLGRRVLGENDPKRVGKGEDLYGYGEKKRRVNFVLTPTASDILDQAATAAELSRSEFLERLIRNHFNHLCQVIE